MSQVSFVSDFFLSGAFSLFSFCPLRCDAWHPPDADRGSTLKTADESFFTLHPRLESSSLGRMDVPADMAFWTGDEQKTKKKIEKSLNR